MRNKSSDFGGIVRSACWPFLQPLLEVAVADKEWSQNSQNGSYGEVLQERPHLQHAPLKKQGQTGGEWCVQLLVETHLVTFFREQKWG